MIDASNLCDHLDLLLLLVAASHLLHSHMPSVLYAEVIVKRHKTYRGAKGSMLCGHVPILSTLLGSFLIECWTNTWSPSLGGEKLLNAAMDETAKDGLV